MAELYQGKYSGEEIDEAIGKVLDGNIVIEPDVLPFLLADFRGEREGTTVKLSAEKFFDEENPHLMSVVWVYNSERVPTSTEDGTKITIQRNELIATTEHERIEKTISGIPEEQEFYARQFACNEKGQWQTSMSVADFNRRLEPVFGDNTPEQIGWAVDNNQIPDTWMVGSEIDIQVGSENLTFVIVGKQHDDLSSGGKAALSLGMKELMTTTHNMNSAQTNVGSFLGSTMSAYLNDTVFNALPEGWRNIIKPVTKQNTAGGDSTAIVTESSKLWLFSVTELGSAYSYAGVTGSKYDYYATNTSLVKKLANGTGAASYWWTRNPYTGSDTYFCAVTTSGSINSYNATSAYGVCFGFCI